MNHYLQKEAFKTQRCISRGIHFGEQKALDLMEIGLHRKGWGYKRIREFLDLLKELDRYYAPAFVTGQEQEVYQMRLDNEIADILKGQAELIPFEERYPDVRTTGYKPLKDVTPIEPRRVKP